MMWIDNPETEIFIMKLRYAGIFPWALDAILQNIVPCLSDQKRAKNCQSEVFLREQTETFVIKPSEFEETF